MKRNPYLDCAKEMHERGNWLEAIQFYKQALQIEASRADIYFELSVCLAQASKFNEAEDCLDDVERLDTSFSEKIAHLRENYQIRKTIYYYAESQRVADIEPLIELIRKKDEAAVQHAVGNLTWDEGYLSKLLWKVDLEEGAIRQVFAALKDQNHEIRFIAAAKFGIMKYAPAVDALVTALRDEAVKVRSLASMALGDIGDRKAIPALEAVASSDVEPSVREQARKALDKLGAEIERQSTSPNIPAAVQHPTEMDASIHPVGEQKDIPSQIEDRTQESAPLNSADLSQKTTKEIKQTPAIAQSTKQAPNTEICKRCGYDITTKTNLTCPNCGHTQWDIVASGGVFFLIILAVAILGGSHISASFWRSVVLWGGGILGGIGLLFVFSWTIKGLLTPKKPLSEDVAGTNTKI